MVARPEKCVIKGEKMDISISTEYIKLDQLLKFAGIAENGADAKFIIMEENVSVNGEVEIRRGRKIVKGDIVQVGEEIINVCWKYLSFWF